MKEVVFSDHHQKNYRYLLTEPAGKNFDPEFTPMLTPTEMLRLGVFGGAYFSDRPSDIPRSWLTEARLSSDGTEQENLNHFGITASQPLSVWKKKGWIHKQDPRGWFQWYCRYYLGRRSPDDSRQIKRWKAYRRHAAQVSQNCRPGDLFCRRKQRQSLLHWAYDSRKL